VVAAIQVEAIVMFCIITANSVQVDTVVHDTFNWLSTCHIAVTEHGFNNMNSECFCTKVKDR